MHFSTVSTLFFAALASAQHQHFHQRRQYNTTGTALGEQTTLTVYATSVHTITSCAATVTDCPARSDLATSEQVVTDTIAVYTTVCPVAQAESASSALLASATSSAIGIATSAYPTVPLSTGASSPVVTGAPGAGSSSVVLTYTLGSGTSTTIVTTTIKHYSTVTEYAVKATSSAAGVEGASSVEGVVDEPTTTYTQTSTSTRYITVEAVTATGSGSGSGTLPTGVVGAVSAPGSGACAPVTVTVAGSTVTVAASTVTVTETAVPVAASTAAGENTYPTSAVSAASVAATSSPVVVSTATVVPIPATSTGAPYGYSNGTDTATKAPYPSSGFLSIVRTSSTSSAAGVVASSTAVVVPTYSEYPTY